MIKEPYVKLKEVIIDNPSVANIDESSILAGVINAPCGPDHLLVQGPKQFLKEFTVGNEIPRDADVTLINAYFCSFFAPLLLKRAWHQITDDSGTDPITGTPILSNKFTSPSLHCDLISPSNLPAAANTSYNITMKYPVDLINGTSLSYKLNVGIISPDGWDTTDTDSDPSTLTTLAMRYGYEFGIRHGQASDNDVTPGEYAKLAVIYWYRDTYDTIGDEYSGYRLISLSADGVNPFTGRGNYWEDIMDDESLLFNTYLTTVASVADTINEIKLYDTTITGNEDHYNNSSSTDLDDFKAAFPWFEDNSDVYNISYISAFGCNKSGSGYEKQISAACQLENTRWFYFCDVSNDASVNLSASSVSTWANGLSLGDTYRTAIVGGWDKNPSVTGWVAPIAPSSLLYQRLYTNKNSNSEFAPLFDMTNGTLSYVKPYKQFTKSDREKLLNNTYPTNWVKYDRTNNVYYMNDNRTHTRKINVMNEEMNVRMVNKIQRDVMLLVQKYKGMLNTVETRLDVVRMITDYMDRYIMSQNYRPVEYRLVCDKTNNTKDIINANKLAIELDVRIQGSIKFIEILNKVFPLGVAFEE